MHQVNLNYCLCWHSEIPLAHIISLKDGERQWVTETEGVSEWEKNEIQCKQSDVATIIYWQLIKIFRFV